MTLSKILCLASLAIGGPRPDYQDVSVFTDDEDLRFISSRRNITRDRRWKEYLAEAFGAEKHEDSDESSSGTGDYSGSGWASGDEPSNGEISKIERPVVV